MSPPQAVREPGGRGLLGLAVALTIVNLVLLVVAFEWTHDTLTGIAEESDNEAAGRAASRVAGVRGGALTALRVGGLIALPLVLLFLVGVVVRYSRAVRRQRSNEALRSYYRRSGRR